MLASDAWYVAESDSEDIAERMREDDQDDVIPEEDNPRCPTIPFPAMEKQRYRRKWRSTLIVKVLGCTFPFPVLSKRLETIWGKHGGLQISCLSHGFYVVCFTSQFDYEQAAAGGPWLIGGHYLTVRHWRKGFNPSSAEVASTLAWVRLPGLPLDFFDSKAVKRIAQRIGKPFSSGPRYADM
ncbi:unnamed protein product [Linum trigynum]|uniref:DUF4283 domain-containing protein n=1 Tax=Linum trigynum TaxID=586398 RepID=A0AAV2FEV8_9ROSI